MIKKKQYIQPIIGVFVEEDDICQQITTTSHYDNNYRKSKDSNSDFINFGFDDDNGNGSENNGLYSY